MNKVTLAILAALSASIALADDFKTIEGKEYKNVKVSRVEPDGIVLITKSGISKVYFVELPKEVQQRFNYDPQKATAYSAQQNAAIQKSNEQSAKEQADLQWMRQQQQDAASLQSRLPGNVRTIREVETDQPNFLDESFLLKGKINVSSHYNYGYARAQQTHYTFVITDDTEHCNAYMERAKAGKLHQQLIEAGGPLGGVFNVVLLSHRYDQNASGLYVELLDYQLEQ